METPDSIVRIKVIFLTKMERYSYRINMKKLLLAGLVASTLALTACGQNIEGIQKEFAEEHEPKETPSFAGYTLVLTEENVKKIKEFTEENKISRSLILNEDLKLEPLPKVSLENDEYDQIVEIRKTYERQVSGLAKKVKDKIAEDAENIGSKITALEAEQKALELSLKEYNEAIAPQQSELDKLQASVEAIDQQMKALKEKFYQDFQRIVVENELPIDKNAKPEPQRFYRAKFMSDDNMPCENTVEVTNVDGKKAKYCIEARIDESQIALAPALVSYGMGYKKLDSEKDLARQSLRNAQKALSDAKVIAKNKFNIDVAKIENEMNRISRQIKAQQSDLEHASNLSRRLENEVSKDDELRKIQSEYSKAVREYAKTVKVEALSESGYDFSEFSDEEDVAELSDKQRGIAIYVFTHAKDRQDIFMAPIDSDNSNSYLEIFERGTRPFSVDFKVKKEKDVIKLASEVL